MYFTDIFHESGGGFLSTVFLNVLKSEIQYKGENKTSDMVRILVNRRHLQEQRLCVFNIF